MDKKELLLIGGIPSVGKTTIARRLSLDLGIETIISGDDVKVITMNFISEEESPYLYTNSYTAHEVENLSIIEAYLKHSRTINEQISKILDNMNDKVVVIEGVTVNNELFQSLVDKGYKCYYFNLYLPEDLLIKRYKEKFTSEYDLEKQIDIMMETSRFLLSQCENNINCSNYKNVLIKIEEMIM